MAFGAKRAVCWDVPRRGFFRYWLGAHGRCGHGVHSPYLYSMCRGVFTRSGWGMRWDGHGGRCLAGEVARLYVWSGAARMVVPKGWGAVVRNVVNLAEGGLLELVAGGGVARGERVVAVVQRCEWARLAERSWWELSQYLGDGSWLVLLGLRADEASWQRWRWLSECMVSTACVDRWSYGLVLYRTGMARYSFGVR